MGETGIRAMIDDKIDSVSRHCLVQSLSVSVASLTGLADRSFTRHRDQSQTRDYDCIIISSFAAWRRVCVHNITIIVSLASPGEKIAHRKGH